MSPDMIRGGSEVYWLPEGADPDTLEGAIRLGGVTDLTDLETVYDDEPKDDEWSMNRPFTMNFDLEDIDQGALDLLFPRCSGYISIRNPANDDPRPWVERALASLRDFIGPHLPPRPEPKRRHLRTSLVWDEGVPIVKVSGHIDGAGYDGLVGVQTAVASGIVTQEWLDREMGR